MQQDVYRSRQDGARPWATAMHSHGRPPWGMGSLRAEHEKEGKGDYSGAGPSDAGAS
jgi:hypothetical protein